MEFVKTYRRENKPVVFLFSKPNSLSLHLLEALLSNFCRVVVFTDDREGWGDITKHLERGTYVSFEPEKNYTKVGRADYFLYVDLLPPNLSKELNGCLMISRSLGVKGFFITSKNSFGLVSKETDLGDNVGVIYLGDVLGPRMDLDGSSDFSGLILNAFSGKKLYISESEKLYPVFLKDMSKLIVRWLFSFGPYGEQVLVSSRERGAGEVVQIIRRYFPGLRVEFTRERRESILPKVKTVLVSTNLEKSLGETINWFRSGTGSKLLTNSKDKRIRQDASKNRKKIVPALAVLLAIAITPFFFIALSLLLVFFAKNSFDKGNVARVRIFVSSSYIVSQIANKESLLFLRVPLVGRLYEGASSLSYILRSGSEITLKGIDVYQESSDLVERVLGDNDYDVGLFSQKIFSDIDYIDTSLSFLESDLKNYPSLYKRLDIGLLKNGANQLRNLSLAIPSVLGSDTKKTYLILFQNNMELRPTGGFIGSFALASFDKGKLVDLSVQDVYSTDGQLRGHVEPPQPIKKYLDEANWFLRDSNWDPNFPVSAQRAEWFLDKEISVPVDGVIAIDLNLAKDILKLTGPINLPDYQMQIASDNLYEKTQSEVETSFFPGSTKKASFLTSLSKEIMTKVTSFSGKDLSSFSKILFNNLQERHVQIFLHNENAEEALAGLGWDGSVLIPTCQGNCYSDFIGLVEANLGVNKANYFITRNYKLNVALTQDGLTKTLDVTFNNSANAALGDAGVYKNYFRVFVPNSSSLIAAKIDNNSLQANVDSLSGIMSLGYYLEVLPGQKKEFSISWTEPVNINLDESGNYSLFIRKQAGLDSYPFYIEYSLPEKEMGVTPNASLTPGGTFVYNTLFSRDISSRVSW